MLGWFTSGTDNRHPANRTRAASVVEGLPSTGPGRQAEQQQPAPVRGTGQPGGGVIGAGESAQRTSRAEVDALLAWVANSSHLQPYRPPASRRLRSRSEVERFSPTATAARPGTQQPTRQEMQEKAVRKVLQEYYKLAETYQQRKLQRAQPDRSMKALLTQMFVPGAIKGKERTRKQLVIDVGSKILMQLSSILVPAVLYVSYTSYQAGRAAQAAILCLLGMGLLLLAERHLRHLDLTVACEPAAGASEQQAADTGSARGGGLAAQEIPTVPWEPARGPRLRHEARIRASVDDKRRSRYQQSRKAQGAAADHSPSDLAHIIQRLRKGIEEVQSALYGEPSGGLFAAQRMGLDEAIMEVDRLGCTVGVDAGQGAAVQSNKPASALLKLEEIKGVLGVR